MKDPVQKLLDESFQRFEAKAPSIPKIMGYDYPTYAALVIFVDAFADAAVKDAPAVAEKFQIAGRDLVESVLDYFEDVGLDIFDYVDQSIGLDLIDRLTDLWGDHFTVDALMQYDKSAMSSIAMIAVGHDIKLDRDIKQLLKDHDAKEPTSANLGMDHDERRYKAAYKALDAISKLQTESRDVIGESFLGLFGIGSEEKDEKTKTAKLEAEAIKLVETILNQCKLKYHLEKEQGDEGFVFRHTFTVVKTRFILKSYLILESKHLSSVLWSEDENIFNMVIVLGYLKDYYALISYGRQKLKSWIGEFTHATSRPE